MFKQLIGVVGYPVTVTLRSSPETLIAGTLSSFDLEEHLLSVVNEKGIYFVNMDDLSVLLYKNSVLKEN